MKAGDDRKKPDWFARKACNYVTSAYQCMNLLLGECKTLQEVNDMKDKQLQQTLAKLESDIAGWDSEKCPVVR